MADGKWSQIVGTSLVVVLDPARWFEAHSINVLSIAVGALVLMELPRVLGIEEFLPTGSVVQIQLRTQVRKQGDAAPELRRLVEAGKSAGLKPASTEVR